MISVRIEIVATNENEIVMKAETEEGSDFCLNATLRCPPIAIVQDLCKEPLCLSNLVIFRLFWNKSLVFNHLRGYFTTLLQPLQICATLESPNSDPILKQGSFYSGL